ncbi:MAG: mechanosensitive ion channel family protein [Neisseriaceae bacterium]|nr:MAG: mechanosensitive ion channel family protein [Neisseriaceae bacterium]
MRSVILSYKPAERANAAQQRIQRILDRGGDFKVVVKPHEQGAVVMIDEDAAFMVLPGDVNTLAGDNLYSLAEQAAGNLRLAITEYREQNNIKKVGHAMGWSLLATVLFIAAGKMWLTLGRKLRNRALYLVRRNADAVKLAGVSALNAESTATIVSRLLNTLIASGMLLLSYLWATFVLRRLPWTRPWGESLTGYLFDTLGTVFKASVSAIPGLMLVVVIFVLGRFISGIIRSFFTRFESGQVESIWLDQATAVPTRKLSIAFVWLVALAMAYPYLPGAQTEAFKGMSVLFGLMVSLGASGVVGQVVSGFILVYSRSLKVGEYVRIGDTEGTVTELGLFATRIQTGMGEEIVLPNNYVTGTPTKNYSRTVAEGKGFVLDTTVTIGYDTPWRQVHAMLLQAARNTAGLLNEPAPYVVQTALSDWYVEYRLVCYAGPEAPSRRALVLGDLHANIQDAFNEYGVQIMSPHYMADKDHTVVVARENWYAPPANPPK